ncbi:MAG TPA: DinB family protein [Candidatus Tectomicrobia bacterium]|nr:DinB family protein [Candidatus Tectomicrobia bacterium]
MPNLLDALARAPSSVIPLVREVPSVILKRRPAPRKWSAHAHACHLAAVHHLFCARLEYMLSHPEPVITPYDPGTQDADDALLHVDVQMALETYAQESAARLKAATLGR